MARLYNRRFVESSLAALLIIAISLDADGKVLD